jgi:Domain of unknown function (DUF4169)
MGARVHGTLARMGDVVNLNKFRKQKAKEERSKEAGANRIKHGRTKAERELEAKTKAAEVRHLDGHRLDPKE